MATVKVATEINNVSNDAKDAIELTAPYMIEAEVEGTSPFLFHRWSCEDVEAKSSAAKGSKAKKTDNTESYLYRDENGIISIPAEYFRQAVIHAAKYRQDPRSPRKSAMDLYKAAIAILNEFCPVGKKEPDFIDRRRVVIQRNGVTRSRPALHSGWKCKVSLQVLLPEYVSPQALNEILQYAGRIIGVGDFRPSFGRYQVTEFKVIELK